MAARLTQPDPRLPMRHGFAQHITPLMSPSKGYLPLATSPMKLFTRMNDQMRRDQIYAAASTLHNTVSLERVYAFATSHSVRMTQSAMESTREEFKGVALEAQVEALFKSIHDDKTFSGDRLDRFLQGLNALLVELSTVTPALDLAKVSQAIEEFRSVYEAHDLVYTPMAVAL